MARLFTAKDTVHDLMDRAHDLLDEEEPEEALKIGQELERRRYSGAFEIQALAFVAMDRAEEAMATLERGVSLAPQAWLLWQQLGNCQSDAGLHASALQSYDAALQIEGADPAQLAYNAAEALSRSGHADAAEKRLAPALAAIGDADNDRGLSLFVIGLQLKLLNQRAAYAEALAFHPDAPDGRHREDHAAPAAYVLARRSEAQLRLGDLACARSLALEAIALYKAEETAQWVLRELGKDRDFRKA